MRLVLASGNPGKLVEFRRLLAPLGFDVIAQAELGVRAADEPHVTFVENALAKARHASAATGLPALADDSGICVDALGGAPGVRSARYAADRGIDASGDGGAADVARAVDVRNNAALVAALAGVGDRRAHYYCVLAFLRHASDPEPILAEGAWHGRIVDVARGARGFGYDPHFEDPSTGLTGAELPLERKNELSHRGKAMRSLVVRLDEETRRGSGGEAQLAR
ncbi:MAG TPA: RdgB/HAM1 family non-canonical purine NTP pyrophosphatase [Casimicrobiaceae bacterium]